jgi:hypothetical protein
MEVNVARIGEKRNAYMFLVGTQKKSYHKKNQAVGEWIIFRWILER